MVKIITIQDALQLPKNKTIFIDTRSPKEFEEDNIPGSINIPIFSNEERAQIGTVYKNNQVEAYQQGFSIYNKKLLDFIKQFDEININTQLIIYCWRGGMRSKTIAELVMNMGKDVYQLIGGYKKFREYVREELIAYKPPFKLIVLQGLAGCGKTDLIKRINPSIDLEGFAKHRSSLFGSLGLKPVSQKMFESRLLEKLQTLKNEKVVFIEGEAKRIGNVFMPKKLFEIMQSSPTIQIKATIENRSKRIVRDYFTHNEDEKIKNIIKKLKVSLSNKRVNELCELVTNKKYETVARVLLEEHYDKKYHNALEEQEYVKTINSNDIARGVKELEEYKESV